MNAGELLKRTLLFLLRMLLIAVLCVGLYRFGSYAYRFGYQLYAGEGVDRAPGREVAVVISEGQSVRSVAEMLHWQGLISDVMVFQAQERLSKYHGQMRAGNYVLNTSWSAEKILAALSGHTLEDEENAA
ncbi:MAG: endolytic transglycosylase MltG [Eubacteriales bacterium]|nr:endolytic transglycosylase MltG [Eubacteriales bacterium]